MPIQWFLMMMLFLFPSNKTCSSLYQTLRKIINCQWRWIGESVHNPIPVSTMEVSPCTCNFTWDMLPLFYQEEHSVHNRPTLSLHVHIVDPDNITHVCSTGLSLTIDVVMSVDDAYTERSAKEISTINLKEAHSLVTFDSEALVPTKEGGNASVNTNYSMFGSAVANNKNAYSSTNDILNGEHNYVTHYDPSSRGFSGNELVYGNSIIPPVILSQIML